MSQAKADFEEHLRMLRERLEAAKRDEETLKKVCACCGTIALHSSTHDVVAQRRAELMAGLTASGLPGSDQLQEANRGAHGVRCCLHHSAVDRPGRTAATLKLQERKEELQAEAEVRFCAFRLLCSVVTGALLSLQRLRKQLCELERRRPLLWRPKERDPLDMLRWLRWPRVIVLPRQQVC